MSYDTLAHIIKMGGTVTFFSLFLVAIIYALWPKNRAKFDRAARQPLDATDTPKLRDIDG